MDFTEIIGWLGFGILVSAWLPQTIQTMREGYTGMNMLFIILYFSSSILLTAYAVLNKDLIFTLLNALLSFGSGINLVYKIFPRKKKTA